MLVLNYARQVFLLPLTSTTVACLIGFQVDLRLRLPARTYKNSTTTILFRNVPFLHSNRIRTIYGVPHFFFLYTKVLINPDHCSPDRIMRPTATNLPTTPPSFNIAGERPPQRAPQRPCNGLHFAARRHGRYGAVLTALPQSSQPQVRPCAEKAQR